MHPLLPYRARVALAAGEPQPASTGTWSGGLWSWAALGDLLGAAPAPVLRGGDGPAGADGPAAGVVGLPADLAAAAAVEPRVEWSSTVPDPGGAVEVVLRVRPGRVVGRGPDVLEVCVDDGEQAWTAFTGTGAERRAVIRALPGAPGLRFRTRGR